MLAKLSNSRAAQFANDEVLLRQPPGAPGRTLRISSLARTGALMPSSLRRWTTRPVSGMWLCSRRSQRGLLPSPH